MRISQSWGYLTQACLVLLDPSFQNSQPRNARTHIKPVYHRPNLSETPICKNLSKNLQKPITKLKKGIVKNCFPDAGRGAASCTRCKAGTWNDRRGSPTKVRRAAVGAGRGGGGG